VSAEREAPSPEAGHEGDGPAGSERRSGRFRAAAAPLRVRGFRLLVIGQTVSTVGDYLYEVGLPFLLLDHGGSAAELGLFLGTYGVARAVATVAAGSLADRFGHRRMMLVADTLRMVVVALLGSLALAGRPALGILLSLAVPLGVGAGLFLPASFAVIPDLVPAALLQEANALESSTAMGASLVGPVLGGIVVAVFGSAAALLGDAFTFAISAASLVAIGAVVPRPARARTAHLDEPVPSDKPGGDLPAAPPSGTATLDRGAHRPEPREPAPEPVGSPAGEWEDAGSPGRGAPDPVPQTFWGFVRSSPLAQGVLTAAFVANLCFGGVLDVALPVLARGPLHGGAAGYGAILAGFGAGGLVGSLLSTLVARGQHRVRLALTLFTLQGVVIALVPFAPGVAGVTALFAVTGVANALANVLFLTVLQRRVPAAMLGRFMSAIVFANFGLYPLSAALAGLAIHHVGAAPLFPLAGAVLVAGVGLGWARREVRDA
jgi:predicted MFS family arabinose efflux permease